MPHEQSAILNTQLGVGDEPNKENSLLVERKQVPDSPFYLVRLEHKWFLAYNKFRITEEYDNELLDMETEEFEYAKIVLEKEHWMITMRLCAITTELMQQAESELKAAIQSITK